MEVREGLYKVDITDQSMYGLVADIRSVFLEDLKENAGILPIGDDTTDVYLYFENGVAVGTARSKPKEDGFKLERIAVRKECQSKGIGRQMMKQLHDIYVPKLKEGQTIYLHSIVKIVQFYERCGYVKVGDLFLEAEIEHFRMELKLN